MAAMVGAFQIRRLVKVPIKGSRQARSGVPLSAGQGRADMTGKTKTYGP